MPLNMSLTVTTGVGSLISVGMSVGDVSSLYALGKRVGNWMTAESGDTDLLNLLQTDALEILRRRGLIDLDQFNKRWSGRARFLMNGRPTELVEDDAVKVLGTLSRFTAVMVSVVAALHGFMQNLEVQHVMKKLLKELLRTTEYGEEALSAQLNDRVRAWTSAVYVRTLNVRVQDIRLQLLRSKRILDGYMPSGDVAEMVNFLLWLLADNSPEFTTTSSDVAGVAWTLSDIAFDMLSVEGPQSWGSFGREDGCKLTYDTGAIGHCKSGRLATQRFEQIARQQATTISLTQPEESEASSKRLRLKRPPHTVWDDELFVLTYEASDLGTKYKRVRPEIFSLAKAWALCVNAEFCQSLTAVFERTDSSTLEWLHEQHGDNENEAQLIGNSKISDRERIDAYTVFQAFLLGYYYAVFLELVDTSSLAIQTIQGAWGFRCHDTLDTIRYRAILNPLTRANLLVILSALLFNAQVDIAQKQGCIGVLGKRALLVNSLVAASDSIESVGGFTLLDVDVGGIPSDSRGLVWPGSPEKLPVHLIDPSPCTVIPRPPEEDFTKHIEPDWAGNPDRALLVMRYKGRRVLEIDVEYNDRSTCRAYVDAVDAPAQKQEIPLALELTLQDLVAGKVFHSRDRNTKIVVQSKGMPGMRYAAVGALSGCRPQFDRFDRNGEDSRMRPTLTSNCVVAANGPDVETIIA